MSNQTKGKDLTVFYYLNLIQGMSGIAALAEAAAATQKIRQPVLTTGSGTGVISPIQGSGLTIVSKALTTTSSLLSPGLGGQVAKGKVIKPINVISPNQVQPGLANTGNLKPVIVQQKPLPPGAKTVTVVQTVSFVLHWLQLLIKCFLFL